MAWDPAGGRLFAIGGDRQDSILSDGWTLGSSTAQARSAVHAIEVPLDAEAQPLAIRITWTGAGSGDVAGLEAPGVELGAWNWASGAWVSLGSHSARVGDAAGDRTLSADLPNPLDDWLRSGRLWLLAVPLASSAPGGAGIASTVWTDDVRVGADYLLP